MEDIISDILMRRWCRHAEIMSLLTAERFMTQNTTAEGSQYTRRLLEERDITSGNLKHGQRRAWKSENEMATCARSVFGNYITQ